MTKKIDSSTGTPSPLGLSLYKKGFNFALFSQHAQKVTLGIFFHKNQIPDIEYPLNQTGNSWHIALEGLPSDATYAYRLEGPPNLLYKPDIWLADPYARSIDSPSQWNSKEQRGKKPATRSHLSTPTPFDWQGVSPPQIAKENLIIYEAHIRGFTQHPSSHVSNPGTYRSLIEKIPYLKKLGINAIELMPVFEFDETHCKNINPETNEPLPNYWGYNPLHFFTPMRRYAMGDPIIEFKTMVRELHRHQILVLLDVVYNHTGEGKEKDYYVHFRGIDNPIYYQVAETGEYRDTTGCGNTINANQPPIQSFILDSLRYWGEEMRVDGFRFDLAAALTRDPNGHHLSHAPIIQAIEQDPLLSKKLLISEAWDASGLYLIGSFSNNGPWHEWNGPYRDRVRRFIKGTDGYAGRFAAALCGSEPLYGPSSTPLSSINFITSHDGYSLRDLVTYQQKHNIANGEGNLDGSDQNESWNCGAEGPTNDPKIAALREKQMRNFLLALFLSQGIPMLLMGDEYGHTRMGNNNPYVQDNEINWFLWDQKNGEITSFISALIDLRQKNSCFHRTKFLTDQDIAWHGHTPNHPDWSSTSRFVACTQENFYLSFNAHYLPAEIELPEGNWHTLINTAHSWQLQPPLPLPQKIKMEPYSALLLYKK